MSKDMSKKNIELHRCILDAMHDLYVRKNNDYGNSVHDTYLKFGPDAYSIRMNDKLNRAINLVHNGTENAYVTSDSLKDTLIDLANYAILMCIELEDDFKGDLDD